LSFATKPLGGKRVTTYALPDFPLYKTDRENDRELVDMLWKALDGADIVIAHNGDRFDLRKSNARFLAHNLKPPSPYKSIDTLKIARKHFQFDSNKLNDLGKYLGVGTKIPHTGAHLWFSCMSGNEKAWRIMRRYNAHDVELLERVYLKLRPFATTHPNLTFFSRAPGCSHCQSKNTTYRGWIFTKTGKRKRIQCKDCGAWSSDVMLLRESSMPKSPNTRPRRRL